MLLYYKDSTTYDCVAGGRDIKSNQNTPSRQPLVHQKQDNITMPPPAGDFKKVTT